MLLNTRARSRERGAVAIIVAVMAVLVFAMAALAVDLSNAFVRTRDVQAQADLAALAAVPELPGSKSAGDPAVAKVADYLNQNQPQDDDGFTPVTTAILVNGFDVDGEVYFDSPTQIRVVAPQARVNYSTAKAVGFDSVDVAADATAGAFSPGLGVMPSYAWKGCDWGPQYILDNSTSIDGPLPTLAHPTPVNDSSVEDLVFSEATAVLTIEGKKLDGVTHVGFFREGSPTPVPITRPVSGVPTNTQASVVVDSSISGAEEVWWVRVTKDGTKWSPIQHGKIQPFPTGETAPECDSHSTEGNYGTLDIPRPSGDATGNDIIVKNIATSLEISLSIFPTGLPKCDGLPSPYIHVPNEGSNCLPVQTGFPNPGVTEGLIDGISSVVPGRLDVANGETSDLCGGADLSLRGKTINNDHLTCFFTDDSTRIADISKKSYSGPAVIDPDIYDSPRFMWLPIVKVEPDTGSGEYTLVDIRPSFLTDQPASATKANPQLGTGTTNGLLMSPSGVRAVKAVIFDLDALPPAKDGSKVTPYVGVGPKLVRLVD